MTMASVRILVADDNNLVRRAIRGLLSNEPDCEICAEAADGRQAIEKARELRPDLVLLDVNMPDVSGFETATLVRQALPQATILIVSSDDAAQLLPSALRAGADGCVDKVRIASNLKNALKKLKEAKQDTARSKCASA
jgi:DNA-binding NarL/FixJ family response regulator